jgi:plastocyanin
MKGLRTPIRRTWNGFIGIKSRAVRARWNHDRQISTRTPRSNLSHRFKRFSFVSVIAISGLVILGWYILPRTTVLAEGHNHDEDHRHYDVHSHDKQLAPHASPVELLKPIGHDNQTHAADIYAKLEHESLDLSKLPVETAILTSAPNVPPPITRDYPVVLKVDLTTSIKKAQLTAAYKYEQWTFNDQVPGPFIRARVGDVVELTLTNKDESGMPHNIDSHAFLGPGGGSAVTTAEENQTKTARFKLLCPGAFVYHCAAAPVPVHIANGMYGLIYVQPAEGDLPPVDKEYYIMQSE